MSNSFSFKTKSNINNDNLPTSWQQQKNQRLTNQQSLNMPSMRGKKGK